MTSKKTKKTVDDLTEEINSDIIKYIVHNHATIEEDETIQATVNRIKKMFPFISQQLTIFYTGMMIGFHIGEEKNDQN